MTKRSKKDEKSQAKVKDFTIVAFVDDLEQAREYETLLRVNDIPAVIKEQLDPSISSKGIAIMVPEDFLDEAHVVIESQDAYDDFYDLALEGEDEGDFDHNVFEDDF